MKQKLMLCDEVEGVEQPSSTAGGGAAGLDVNWDALDQEITALDNVEDVEVVVDTPAAVEPTVPITEPASPAPSVPAAPETPTETPGSVEAPPVAAPTETQVSREQLRSQYGAQLAQQYALGEDDARALLVEPEQILPKLAAQVHLNVLDSVLGAVMSQIPQIITSVQAQGQASAEAEGEFFGAWPQLKDAKYKQAVYTAVATYRALNPQATRTEVVRGAGINAMISLRLPLPPELLQMDVAQAGAPPATFIPAAPGSGGLPQPTRPLNQNPFVALSEEFSQDDRGG